MGMASGPHQSQKLHAAHAEHYERVGCVVDEELGLCGLDRAVVWGVLPRAYGAPGAAARAPLA